MAPLTDPLSEPEHGLRVVAIDLVGHGRSDAPADVDRYSMTAAVDHFRSVTVALDLGSVHLVGYSMGGRTALSFAAAHPTSVASLHLIGATAGLRSNQERSDRRSADDALAARILDEGLTWFVDYWMAMPLFASQARLGVDRLAADRQQRLDSDPLGLANSLRGMGTGSMPPLHDALAAIREPVQLIVGADDQKFRAVADELELVLPNAETVVIPDAGHAAHLEQPAIVAAAIARSIVNTR